jgi:hypothetical protein
MECVEVIGPLCPLVAADLYLYREVRRLAAVSIVEPLPPANRRPTTPHTSAHNITRFISFSP